MSSDHHEKTWIITTKQRADFGNEIIDSYLRRYASLDQYDRFEAAAEAITDVLHAYCEDDAVVADKLLDTARWLFEIHLTSERETRKWLNPPL